MNTNNWFAVGSKYGFYQLTLCDLIAMNYKKSSSYPWCELTFVLWNPHTFNFVYINLFFDDHIHKM